MQNIIVSDIFGKTEALVKFASNFRAPTEILDPYNGKTIPFKTEHEAYEYFSEHITLSNYTEKLRQKVQSCNTSINLIGFSVGASAIWNISATAGMDTIVSAYCYYGSQIRNNRTIEPLFPIKLTFPQSEIHFCVIELMEDLSHKKNVTLEQVPYLHGFMNFLSVNYDQNGYDKEVQALRAMPFNASR